jgi:hypothetical protein
LIVYELPELSEMSHIINVNLGILFPTGKNAGV